MASDWWADDDRLMAALAEAVRALDAIPRRLIEAGKATYTWYNFDAELAALTYDSALDEGRELARTRDEPALLRNLTFASRRLTIELEFTHDALLGQIVPAQPGEIHVHNAHSRVTVATVDDLGSFIIRPVPTESIRLHFQTAQEPSVMTGWIAL
jgi:hypothetical protein